MPSEQIASPEKIETAMQRLVDVAERAQNNPRHMSMFAKVMLAGLSLEFAAWSFVANRQADEVVVVTPEAAIACAGEMCDFSAQKPVIQPGEARPKTFATLPRQKKTVAAAQAQPAATTIPSPATVPAEPAPPAPPPTVRIQSREFRTPVDQQTNEQLNTMQLTVEGYEHLFDEIKLDFYDYAQQQRNFNPAAVGISQNDTEWVTAHYTAGYFNFDSSEISPTASGEMDVKRLIDFEQSRGNPCCGINFVVDRNGTIFQLAPYKSKLRHNPPYDGRTVGFEMEAFTQSELKAVQLEKAAYLTIAMLSLEGKLSPETLANSFHGHGEDRDALRDADPHTKWDDRNDCDQPLMDVWRAKIAEFIRTYPDIAQRTKPLR